MAVQSPQTLGTTKNGPSMGPGRILTSIYRTEFSFTKALKTQTGGLPRDMTGAF